MRPTPIAASMSPYHNCSSFSCFVTSAAFNSFERSRVVSSRATIGSSPAATTLRRSRRSSSSRSAFAASARSSHSATRSFGNNCSAIDSRPAAGIASLPSAVNLAFCSCTAARTAGMPPCRARSATARCSSGRSASTALRCARPGFRRLAFGRWGSSGGGVKCGRLRRSGRGPRRSPPAGSPSRGGRLSRRVSPPGRSVRGPPGRPPPGRSPPGRSPPGRSPPGRSPPGRPSRRGRSPRSPRSLRGGRSPRSRRASCCVTASNGVLLGINSSRPDLPVLALGSVTDVMVMPSSSISASAR